MRWRTAWPQSWYVASLDEGVACFVQFAFTGLVAFGESGFEMLDLVLESSEFESSARWHARERSR